MLKIVIQFRDSYDFCPTREWEPNGRVAGFAIGRKKNLSEERAQGH